MIKKIRISNFKSFNDLEINLSNLNILIGANASGKSNFVQIFKFLREAINEEMEDAISLQGGVEYLRNINIGADKNLSMEIVRDEKFDGFPVGCGENSDTKIEEMTYKMAIEFRDNGRNFKIVQDQLIQKGKEISRGEIKKEDEIEHIFSYANEKLTYEFKNLSENLPEKGEMPLHLYEKDTLLSHTLLYVIPYPFIKIIFNDISIYDFNPKLSKSAISISGKSSRLEENGGNLAIVLKNLLKNEDKKRMFSNLIKYLLPFIEDLEIEKWGDKSLLIKLQERYCQNQYLPAFLISDGTINITALIVALYFEKTPFIIIEEPERNIHPSLISKIIGMMKEASQKKQIIVTTHNPEIVKYAGLENILLIARDKEGFSTISRPGEKEEVEIFLKNEIGIEDLYVQNLLEM